MQFNLSFDHKTQNLIWKKKKKAIKGLVRIDPLRKQQQQQQGIISL